MKYKKILLGSLAAGITTLVPIATIISCGSNTTKPKNVKVEIPTVENTKLHYTGDNGKGTFKIPVLKGTTVNPSKSSGLSNGEKISISFTLNKGYVWKDGTSKVVKIDYTVTGLEKVVVRPTKAGGKFTGYNGSGTYTPPVVTGVTIRVDKTTELTNGNKIEVTYILLAGYAWKSGAETGDITFNPMVEGLTVLKDVQKPSNTFGTVTGIDGKGVYTPEKLAGTTLEVDSASSITNLSNESTIMVKYTLDPGYKWDDGFTTGPVTITYEVTGLPTGVAKPGATTTAGSVTGINNFGKFLPTALTGTTITSAAKTGTKNKYKNDDTINVTYTLQEGYAWADDTTSQVTSVYKVSGLADGVTIPTTKSVPLTFTGIDTKGTFIMPDAPANTTVTITKGGQGTTPSVILKNGDEVELTFTLTQGKVWTDNTSEPKTVNYKVAGLPTGVVKPGATTTAATMGGYEGKGTIWPTDLTGTAITTDKTEGLSNGDKVTFTYTLKPGYAWQDGTNVPAVSVYTVSGLHAGLADPTTTSAKIIFTGTSGSGTFTLPTYANTTSAYVEAGGQTTKTPPTNLKNGDTVKILFTANTGYAFTGDTGMEFELAYTVSGLTKVSISSKNAFSEKMDTAVSGLLDKPANLYYDAIYKIISDYSNGGYTPAEIKGLSSMTITVINYATKAVMPNDTTTTIPKKTIAIIKIKDNAVINDISMSIDEDIVV